MPDPSCFHPKDGRRLPGAACALVAALALGSAGAVHAAEPPGVWPGAAAAASATPEAFCGQSQAAAPDIMTYNRETGTQVDISNGASTHMSALNRRAGASASVAGDLAAAATPYSCDASALTRTGHAVVPLPGGGAQVLGYDDVSRRRYQVVDRRDGGGPSFVAADARTGARAAAGLGPDGRATAQAWGGRSVSSQGACIRAAAKLTASVGGTPVSVGGAVGASVGPGDCP